MENITRKLLKLQENLNSYEENEQILSETLSILHFLCSKNIQIKITPLTNKKCMYCKKCFFDEKRDLLNITTCDCFQRVHVSCLEKERENALKTNQQLECYKCHKLFENNVIESGINYFHTNKDIQTNRHSSAYNDGNININFLQKKGLLKCLKCKKYFDSAYKFDCSHQVCENCLKKYVQKIKSKIKNLNDFKCPSASCKNPIPIENLQEILGNTEFEQINEKFLQKTVETNLNANETGINCPHCKNIQIIGKESHLLKEKNFRCQICKKETLVSKLNIISEEKEKKTKKTKKCNIF